MTSLRAQQSAFRSGIKEGREQAESTSEKVIIELYVAIGAEEKRCPTCNRRIWFIRTRNGELAPYGAAGVPHNHEVT